MRSILAPLLALGLAGALFGACGKKSDQPVVGVSLLTQTHDFYKDLEEGLREEAKARGFTLVINSAEFDPIRQARQIDDFVTQRVTAMIVCPCDSDTIGKNLEGAEKAGIPVFTADVFAKTGKIVAQVASDNVQGGRLAAQAMTRFLGDRGKILIINHGVVASVQDRVRGFEEEIKKHPSMHVVAKQDAGGKREKALKVMEDMLQAHPDLNGVFGINDDSALGALSAIEAAGRADIVVIGYDATPDARQAIARGSALKADVVQDPRKIGRTTIDMIAKHLKGEAVAPIVGVDVSIVDREALKK
jgi:ribose transport system substrate-binding protein